MAGSGEDFDAWLASELDKLEIDAEVYAEYVRGIVDDGEMDLEERLENVNEILSATVECDLSSFQTTLAAKCKVREEQLQLQKHQAREKKRVEELEALKRDQLLAEEAEKIRQEKKYAKKNRLKEEIEMRERLIQAYGYEDEEEDDGEAGKKKEGEAEPVGQNMNKAYVQSIMKEKREQAKQSHVDKVKREKDLLARDRQRKEERKRKTVKKEKQRM